MDRFKKHCLQEGIALLFLTGFSFLFSACGGGADPKDSAKNTASSSTTATSVPSTTQPYDRDLYKHWVDVDGDCQNTRHEVLIAESTPPVTFKTEAQCTVIAGRWEDPYTGLHGPW